MDPLLRVSNRRVAVAALVGATGAVSVSAVLVEEAQSDAATVVWLRMALAVVILAPWVVGQMRRRTVAVSRHDLLLTVVAGLLLALHFLAWTASLAQTSVAASVVLVSLHPLIVAPIGARLLGDSVGPRLLTGIGLAIAGTVATCAGAVAGHGDALRGDLLALAGGVALAGYLLIGRGRRARGGVALYSMTVYAIVAITAVSTAAAVGDLHAPTLRTLVACIGLAAICTVGGHTAFNWTLHRLPASTVSLSFLGEPPLAAILALAVLGQRPTVATIIGGVLIVGGLGVGLSNVRAPRINVAPPG